MRAAPYGAWESGGRCPRQLGQIRKEAATTNLHRVVPAPTFAQPVDLCHIDPPFNSKRNYFQIYNNQGSEDRAQAQAFVDTWNWGGLLVEQEINKNISAAKTDFRSVGLHPPNHA